ncbi:MAG: DUF6340 family protein [Prolixibacteraceae bacterium]|nr:DUF6340 family protein [Prolixibacteraceae bacterium]
MNLNITKKLSFALIIIAATTSLSCVSTRSLLIDIPQSPSKVLPQSIQSLAIVTQVIDEDSEDISADSLQNIFFKNRFNLDTIIVDRQMADTTMKALGELLYESGRYDFVIPVNRFLKQGKEVSPNYILPWEEVNRITESFNTDAVLSLDYLKTRIITSYKNEAYYDPYQNGFYSAAKAEMLITYNALFRVYDPEKKSIILNETIKDTLLWEDADISARSLFGRFTPVKQALSEAGISIALDLSDKIAVRWNTVTRWYFHKGNSAISDASLLVKNGETENALIILSDALKDTKSKSLKSKMQLNIAVCYEILGDIDQAISMALESYNTQYRTLTYDYLEILKRRKSKLINQ